MKTPDTKPAESPSKDDILNALRQSIDNFQEALNLSRKHPQINAEDILMIQQAIAKANEAYTSIWQLQFIHDTERPIRVLAPLKFKR